MSYKVFEVRENNLVGLLILVKNGALILISEKEYLLGTLAISIPPMLNSNKSLSHLLPIFGFKNEILAKTISEKISSKIKKITVASINVKDEKSKDSVLKLVNKMLLTLEKENI